MKKTFRIKEYDYGTFKNFCVQRKSIFGFWYNPDNTDGYTTGYYDTLQEAKDIIKSKKIKVKTKIIRFEVDI